MRAPPAPSAIVAAVSLFPPPGESLASLLPAASPPTRRGQLLRMDRLCGLAVVVADQLLLGAAASGRWVADSTAIVIASAYGCHKTDEEYFRGLLAGAPSPRLFAYTLPSSPAGEVSIHHQLRGPSVTIVSGRSAGLEALVEAQQLLADGHATACLVIACDVAAPALPEQPEDAAMVDGASGLLLMPATAAEAAGGFLVAAADAFVAADPPAALLDAAARLPVESTLDRPLPPAYADPQSARFMPPGRGSVRPVATPAAGASSSLAVLTSLAEGSAESGLVLAADPSGQAAVALWRRHY